ncbi:MAG TPA: hypothetical protein P5140_08050 [Methanofastidiosum sp.]|nr:hypothetical protein [Methanofastidiosum sp.]
MSYRNQVKQAQTSNQKTGDMVKDVDVKIEPVKEIPETEEQEAVDILSEELGDKNKPEGETVVDTEKKSETSDVTKRIKQVVEDVKKLKIAIQNYLMSSYKLKLSEDELDELMRKILSALSSIVADITSERVESLAENANILLPSKK